jgi:YceI-like protein
MRLGPENGTLTVRTGKGGAAAKAGHNLEIEVTRWSATLDAETAELTADAASLRVVGGSGGISPLGEKERAGIAETIDEEVLKDTAIAFRSTSVTRAGDRIEVAGELELSGTTRPLTFALRDDGGHITGSARLKQTDWGVKPYSALFGTLKVADVVEIAIDARSQDG